MKTVYYIISSSGHSPQGECGLKLHEYSIPDRYEAVTPRKGSVD